MKNAYEVKTPDFDLSPYTGMTKKHYIECATYLLERAFKHVASSTLLLIPRGPGQNVSAAARSGLALPLI
jgi:hypothetical protein